MADSIDDLYVVLTGDAAPLLAVFTEATAAGEEMAAAITASLAEVKAAMAESMAGVGAGAADTAGIAALGAEAETAAAEVATATTEMDGSLTQVGITAESSAAEVQAAFAALGAEMEATAGKMSALSDEDAALVAKMQADQAAMGASAAEADAGVTSLGDAMAGTTTKAAETNTTLGMSNNALLGVGAAAIGAAYESVKMAGDFQQSITKLSTSAGEAQSNLTMVGNGILSMAGQVGYSAQDLSNAMYMVESSGQHGADALTTLKAAAEGAKTENANLTTVVNAVTDAMKDYHMPASQAADVTSKLVAATSDGKTSFEDLSGAMSAILPKASAAGVSLNDILGMLSSMTVHGESAQQSAQNLADALSHMAAPTAAQSKELAALGINATQLSQSLGKQGLSGAVNEIATAIQNQMGPGTTSVVLNLQNALKGLPPQVQQLGQQVLTGSTSMAAFTAQVKTLDPISAKQAQSFATLAGSMHTIGTQSMSGAQVMQSYTGAMQKAMGTSAGLSVALMTTGENASTTTQDIKDITNASADASGNVAGWTQVQGNFNQKIDEAKSAFGAMAISIGEKLLPVLTVFASGIADIFTFLSQHQGIAVAFAVLIGGTLVLAFTALIAKMGAWVVESAAGLVNNMVAWTTWLLQKVGILTASEAAVTEEAAAEVAATSSSEAKRLAATVTGMGRWLATKLGILSTAETAVAAEGVEEVAAETTSNASRLANAVSSGAVWVATKVTQGAAAVASAVTDGAAASAAWVASNARMLASQLADGAAWLATWVAQGVAAAASSVAEAAVAAAAWLAANATLILATGGIVLAIGAVIAIGYELVTHWQQVKQVASEVWNAVTSAVSNMTNAVTGMINGLIGMFANAGSWLLSAGYNVVVGLWNGIASGWSWLENQVSGLASSLLSTAKSALGISSPSKLFADEVGAWIAPGLAQGINAEADQAVTAARNLAGKVTAAMSGMGQGEFTTTGGLGVSGGGLAAGLVTAGGGGQVTNLNVNVQGHVWTTQDLVTELQQQLLRYNIRNPSNATNYAFA